MATTVCRPFYIWQEEMQMYENPYLQQMMQNPFYKQAQPNPGIQWVQGREGAKAYQLQPNGNAVLMDRENEGIFYIKTSDTVGMCNLRTFKFAEVTEQETRPNLDDYVKKSELQALLNEMLGGGDNGKQSISTT